MDDSSGAFCEHGRFRMAGAPSGPLAGLEFAVKDVFHIAGHRTGFGHPDWLASHPPATMTATAVQRLLDGGATMIGKTHSDEMAYSLTGENIHYGTPVNPRDPARVPGGSSNGSVVAVAGGLADFALGTDCGGSVRLPASYCGILGMRPSHGRVSLEGVIPFASSFDVAGWFARDGEVLERVGRVLLDSPETPPPPPRRLLIARDGFDLLEDAVRNALDGAVAEVEAAVGKGVPVTVSENGLEEWMEIFRHVQASEIWANHGAWIGETRPRFGPGIKERFAWAATVDAATAAANRARIGAVRGRLDAMLGTDGLLCLPTSPRVAPLKDIRTDTKEITYRYQAMCLLCIAGLGGLPQVSLPLATLGGLPLGLSLIGARGSDSELLALCRGLMAEN